MHIYDTATDQGYTVSSTHVNQILESNPRKFGFYQYPNPPLNADAGVLITNQNCLLDKFTAELVTPTLASFLPRASRFTDTLPILNDGLIVYQDDNSLAWIGVTPGGRIVGYPVVPVSNNGTIVSPSRGCLSSTGFLPNKTAFTDNTCAFYSWIPAAFTINCAMQFGNTIIGFANCANESYYITYTSFGVEATCDTSAPLNILMRVYPNPDASIYIALDQTTFYSNTLPTNAGVVRKRGPSKRGLGSRTTNVTALAPFPTSIQLPLQGQLLLSSIFNGYQIQFVSTGVAPVIDNVNFAGNYLTVTAHSTLTAGVCYVSTTPMLFSTAPMSLSNLPGSQQFLIMDITFQGCVNVTVSCGKNAASLSTTITVNEGYGATIPTNVLALNPFQGYVGLSTTGYVLKVVGIFLCLLAFAFLLVLVWKLYCYCRKPRVGTYKDALEAHKRRKGLISKLK
jgi:hypothetical protein